MEGSVQEQSGYGHKSRHAFKWEEKSFFEDVEHKRLLPEVVAMRRLFHYCASVAQVRFGSGYIDGSFSAVFPGVSSRPPLSVFSSGIMRLSFGNLCDEEISYICRDALADGLRESPPIAPKIPLALRGQTINVRIEEWSKDVEGVISALESMRSKVP